MDVTRFEIPIAVRTASDELLIVFIDGVEAGDDPARHRCVGLFLCRIEAGRALIETVGSALKEVRS